MERKTPQCAKMKWQCGTSLSLSYSRIKEELNRSENTKQHSPNFIGTAVDAIIADIYVFIFLNANASF